jgi:hypothetical protein
MATVKFNYPGEFLAELKQDCQQVDRGIVRVTTLYRGSTGSPGMRHLSVVATARVGRDLVRLDCYCGDLWQIGDQDSPHDQQVMERIQRLSSTLQDGCSQLGLEVRAGLLEETQ